MCIDAILASACAPLSYQPVEIDGDAYWDGSYAANPALWPLYEDNLNSDILLVELTPPHRAETPLSAKNIVNRLNEMASVQGLVAELRDLAATNRQVPGADVRMHVLSIADQPAGMLATEPSIKRTVSRELFEMLRQDGRRACAAWLAEHAHALGRQPSVDIAQRYLQPHTRHMPAKKQKKSAASA
jgi:NTE family protein